jgi:hypothetical protein
MSRGMRLLHGLWALFRLARFYRAQDIEAEGLPAVKLSQSIVHHRSSTPVATAALSRTCAELYRIPSTHPPILGASNSHRKPLPPSINATAADQGILHTKACHSLPWPSNMTEWRRPFQIALFVFRSIRTTIVPTPSLQARHLLRFL